VPSLTAEELLDTAEADKMLAQARAALVEEKAKQVNATNLDNKDVYEVPDLACVPLSELVNGTGVFDPKAITSIAYLKNLFTSPHLHDHLANARARLLQSLDNKHHISESRIAPFRLVCSWVLHAARQPWWSWRHCNDSMEMNQVRCTCWVC
jgi:hypothetical protein